MANESSVNLNFTINTPLGPDSLTVAGFSGNEKISEIYKYSINVISDDPEIDFDSLTGKHVSLSIALSDGGERFISGHIKRFTQTSVGEDLHNYEMEIVPWLWFLTQRTNCRIFQQKTVPDIIKDVFEKAGFKGKYEDRLSGSYSLREYCVQYRETDFDFVSRLMQDEGIFYFFKHENEKHTLVLCDSSDKLESIKPSDTLTYYLSFEDAHIREGVNKFVFEQQVRSTKVILRDYDFQKPGTSLESKNETGSELELYDYPGKFLEKTDGDRYAKNRLEAQRSEVRVFSGISTSRRMTVGSKFQLSEHPREDYNDTYTIISVSQRGDMRTEEATYLTEFECILSTTPFRPHRTIMKPTIPGLQTAVVVGPSGEEIWLDEYGRVKVQFHWDREGAHDEKSSCFIRVAEQWAGKNWGTVFNPRIGQEVIVQFEEGDPDRPVITGRLYNAEQMPPYNTGTQNGIKSRSSKGGEPDNCNEIRFEDKKDQEQFLIHAEKDYKLEVEHDEIHTVGNDRSSTITNNQTISVGKDEKTDIKENRTETVGKSENVTITESRTLEIGKNDKVKVGTDKSEEIGQNLKFSVGKSGDVSFGENLKEQISKKGSLSVGKEYVIDVGESFTLKCGDASITLKKDGTIEIKGKNISLQGSGMVDIKASGNMTIKGSMVAIN
jgi:type VI secretion system secreted protein VgrG